MQGVLGTATHTQHAYLWQCVRDYGAACRVCKPYGVCTYTRLLLSPSVAGRPSV
jgi:hypothetical protein